jgi:hypothetical protein
MMNPVRPIPWSLQITSPTLLWLETFAFKKRSILICMFLKLSLKCLFLIKNAFLVSILTCFFSVNIYTHLINKMTQITHCIFDMVTCRQNKP